MKYALPIDSKKKNKKNKKLNNKLYKKRENSDDRYFLR